jgi:phage portal protein BeeE
MKWFGRKAARDEGPARPFLLRGAWGALGGVPGEAVPRSYEAQVREAYLGNAVAQRCVRLVAEAVGSVVVDATQQCAEGGAAPPPSASRMVPLPVPGRILGSALLEAVATHLLLHGNAFVAVAQDAGAMPAGLFALRPERVKVEADSAGWPAAYLYRAGAAERRYLAADGLGRPAIVHLRSLHPLDDHYGLGCLGAAAGAVGVHNAAARWNKALLDNAARPSGALVYEPGDGSGAAQRAVRAAQGRDGGAVRRARAMPGGRCCWRAAEVAGDEPVAGRHGFRGDQGGGGAGDRAGLRSAADAGRGFRATMPMPITGRRCAACGG